MTQTVSRQTAFTLIELLIVVAIIAILAAIAVPNFLEAQVRSKVSKTVSDMRSLATALETYAVDNNGWYPPNVEYHDRTPRTNIDADSAYFHARVPSWLSTPVAHISSIPYDPFVVQQSTVQTGFPWDMQTIGRRHVFNNWKYLFDPTSGYSAGDVWNGAIAWTGYWLLYSYGPDKEPFHGAAATFLPYDASNGTISDGNIIRTQKSAAGIDPHPRTGTFFWN
jgi:prepilin-type N-terminal cleavage/methylation domain-containing protein